MTGGSGFIGSHLVDALARHGARVRVLDDLSTGRPENLESVRGSIEFVQGDIRDEDTCRRACTGVRALFHLAALGSVPRSMMDPTTTLHVNVQGTANVFDAARRAGVERVIYASSSSVYGDSERLPKREGEEGRPLSPYALSKAMGERLAETFEHVYQLRCIGLRYFNVFGPRQDPRGPYAAVVPLFFSAYAKGLAPRIHGDGTQSRDFTYVDDAVNANLLALMAPESSCGGAYNVAGGSRTTVNELAALIREEMEGGPNPVHGPARPGDVPHSFADLELVREVMCYEPRTSLRAGLKAVAAWYRGEAA